MWTVFHYTMPSLQRNAEALSVGWTPWAYNLWWEWGLSWIYIKDSEKENCGIWSLDLKCMKSIHVFRKQVIILGKGALGLSSKRYMFSTSGQLNWSWMYTWRCRGAMHKIWNTNKKKPEMARKKPLVFSLQWGN